MSGLHPTALHTPHNSFVFVFDRRSPYGNGNRYPSFPGLNPVISRGTIYKEYVNLLIYRKIPVVKREGRKEREEGRERRRGGGREVGKEGTVTDL